MKRIMFPCLWLLIGVGLGGLGGMKMSQIALHGTSIGYVGVGQQYAKEGDYVRAIAYFNRAIALEPNSFIAQISLADSYYSGHDLDLALEAYERVLQLSQQENAGGQGYIKARIEGLRGATQKEKR